jgi:phosphohistidine phosphatase
MRLSLLRHGRAEWPAGRYADFDRPLDPVGLREAAAAAAAVAALDPPSTLLLHSSAVRTTQTAMAVRDAHADGQLTMISEPRLYLAGPRRLCEILDELAVEAAHVVLVGHNPGLSELAQRMPGAQGRDLATGQWVSAQLWASSRSLAATLFPK